MEALDGMLVNLLTHYINVMARPSFYCDIATSLIFYLQDKDERYDVISSKQFL
jgi:hypothetical protein